MEKRSALAYPRRLLHRVGDDDNGVFLAQFVNQLFNYRRGDRVERRGRFVH